MVGSLDLALIVVKNVMQIIRAQETGSYPWAEGPYQPCDVIIYLIFLSGCFWNTKFRKWVTDNLVIFAFVYGLCILAYPGVVFGGGYTGVYKFIWVESMFTHTTFPLVSVFLILMGQFKLQYRSWINSFIVWLGLMAISIILNSIIDLWLPDVDIMWAGPHVIYSFPFLSEWFPPINTNYGLFLLTYTICVVVFSNIAYWFFYLINFTYNRIHKMRTKRRKR